MNNKLRKAREERDLRLSELARALRIHPSILSRLERGLAESWPRVRRDSARLLGVSEAKLYPKDVNTRRRGTRV